MRHALIPRIALAAACAALVASCGGNGGGQNDTARDAAQAYVQARNQGDAGRVCELYSEQLIQQLHAANCEAFVKEQTAGVATSLTLIGVQESGDHATATIQATVAGEISTGKGELRISLERQNGEWKITSLGRGAQNPE
jgi:ketosteroid isomerase-like protein